MPIRDIPFFQINPSPDIARPYLPIKIVNPSAGQGHFALGLIDTGADECCIPASFANLLGHDLKRGRPKSSLTAGGMADAFGHTTTLEIFDYQGERRLVIKDVVVDYMPNLRVPLLGVKHFLDGFELRIDYPRKVFSIIRRDG